MLSELQVFARAGPSEVETHGRLGLEGCVQKSSDSQQLLVKEAEMMNSAGEAELLRDVLALLRPSWRLMWTSVSSQMPLDWPRPAKDMNESAPFVLKGGLELYQQAHAVDSLVLRERAKLLGSKWLHQ